MLVQCWASVKDDDPTMVQHLLDVSCSLGYPWYKWNESGFMPLVCIYRLNWAKRTSWGWWDDTVLQTQDSKFEPWRSEAKHATSRSRRLPTMIQDHGCASRITHALLLDRITRNVYYFSNAKILKRHNQAKIIKKSVFLFWLPYMTIIMM